MTGNLEKKKTFEVNFGHFLKIIKSFKIYTNLKIFKKNCALNYN